MQQPDQPIYGLFEPHEQARGGTDFQTLRLSDVPTELR
jgi:hypothetical protein